MPATRPAVRSPPPERTDTVAELKTRPITGSVTAFLDSIADESKRRDSFALLALMQAVTGAQPVMWGDTIVVGFGSYHYRGASGREGDWGCDGPASCRDRDWRIQQHVLRGWVEAGGDNRQEVYREAE